MVLVPALVPERSVPAARHTDSLGWSFRFATLLAHATGVASTAREKGSAGPAHRRRDSGTLYAIWPVRRRPGLRPSGDKGSSAQ